MRLSVRDKLVIYKIANIIKSEKQQTNLIRFTTKITSTALVLKNPKCNKWDITKYILHVNIWNTLQRLESRSAKLLYGNCRKTWGTCGSSRSEEGSLRYSRGEKDNVVVFKWFRVFHCSFHSHNNHSEFTKFGSKYRSTSVFLNLSYVNLDAFWL